MSPFPRRGRLDADQPLDQLASLRRPLGSGLTLVGTGHELERPIYPDPPERLRLPRPRPVPDPREPGELRVSARDQIGESAPGEVSRSNPIADVASRPGKAGGAVQTDRAEPIARHTQRSSPAMRDPRRVRG